MINCLDRPDFVLKTKIANVNARWLQTSHTLAKTTAGQRKFGRNDGLLIYCDYLVGIGVIIQTI